MYKPGYMETFWMEYVNSQTQIQSAKLGDNKSTFFEHAG